MRLLGRKVGIYIIQTEKWNTAYNQSFVWVGNTDDEIKYNGPQRSFQIQRENLFSQWGKLQEMNQQRLRGIGNKISIFLL